MSLTWICNFINNAISWLPNPDIMIFFQFPKHIMHLSLQKNTTHVPEIQNYKLCGFVYVMLDDGGNSS